MVSATTEIYTLSLHDALPILDFHSALGALRTVIKERPDAILVNEGANTLDLARGIIDMYQPRKRSEEHTSELQSRENLVCRLLLEKKKKKTEASAASDR